MRWLHSQVHVCGQTPFLYIFGWCSVMTSQDAVSAHEAFRLALVCMQVSCVLAFRGCWEHHCTELVLLGHERCTHEQITPASPEGFVFEH